MEKYAGFEEMKMQLALLNEKLKKEEIVNERLMRRAMKNKAWGIRRKIIVESVVTAIMIPYFIWVMPAMVGVSIEFCCFVVFFMLLALVYNGYIYMHFRPQDFFQGNLIEARKDTLKLKRLYAFWLKFIGIPFIVVFLSWFIYEMSRLYQGESLHSLLIGMLIGAVIGAVVGSFRYRKVQGMANEILEQIDDVSKE